MKDLLLFISLEIFVGVHSQFTQKTANSNFTTKKVALCIRSAADTEMQLALH